MSDLALVPPATKHSVKLVLSAETSGNTAIVHRAVSQAHIPAVHFYPREEDTTLADCVHGLAHAMAPIASGLAQSFASAVEYARQCTHPHEEFALWFGRHLKGVKATIVLHELDRIEEPAFFKLLREMIEHTGPGLQWICVAASEPPLPWETWRSFGMFDGAALEVDAAPQSEAQLQAQIDCLSEPHRELLIACSVLAEFDAAFVRERAHAGCWNEIVAIARSGMLLERPGGVMKFGPGVRALLERQLVLRGAGAVEDARMNAARAYEASNRPLIALRLYALWGQTGEVLRVCEAHGFDMIEQGHLGPLSQALATLDLAALHDSPLALTVKAMEESRVGRHDTAEAWFLQAIAGTHGNAQKAPIVYRYALDLIRNGRLDAIALLEQYVNDVSLAPDLRASIRSALATAYVLGQRFSDAREAIDQALDAAQNDCDGATLAKVLHHAAWVALFTGDAASAQTLAERAVTASLESGMYEFAARAYSVLYNIAYDVQDDPAATSVLLERILDCAMQAGSAPMRLFALLGMFDLATERGDAQELHRVERSLLSYEVDYGDPMTSAALLSGQALFLAGRGRFGHAYDLLVPTAERQITGDRCALRYSELALYAAAAHRFPEAGAAIEHLRTLLPELDRSSRRTMRATANLVLAYHLLAQTEAAAKLLQQLVGAREGLSARSRAFVDAIAAVVRRWSGSSNRALLGERLQTLQLRELGGFAAALSALPLAPSQPHAQHGRSHAPQRVTDALQNAREEIIHEALEEALDAGSHTLLADLLADATVDRLQVWVRTADDRDVVRWVETSLQTHHNAGLVAHLFGETIHSAGRALHRAKILDDQTRAALARLRQNVDAHVSTSQVRLASEEAYPVDPIDAKLDELLHRLLARDAITYEHSRCVGAWAARLAKRMHLQRTDAVLVMRSGLIHDIGKILTPSDILQAPRRLFDEEWTIMRRHTLDGVRLLEPVSLLHSLIPAVRWHHERYDGKGYPDGIPLADIPFAARMVSVADAFNAMIAPRPYRDPLSPLVAIEELKRGSGTQFDPAVVESMIDVVLRPDR